MTTMSKAQAQEWLTALGDDARQQLQATVDRAVRFARRSSYCGQFNEVMRAVLPAFVVDGIVYDSDGVGCNNQRLGDGEYTPDGYDRHGRDRDGYDRRGRDRDGYMPDGFTPAHDRDGFNQAGWSGNEEYRYYGVAPHGDEDDYYSGEDLPEDSPYRGQGRYVYLNRDGEIRRGPVVEVEEPPFNPTTWAPALVTVGASE